MPKVVLVVEDEKIIAEIARRKLQDEGYEVMVAYDGEEALGELKKKTPDLILLDIQMPKMNGYTFIMEKSKFPQYNSIPIVVLTAYGETEPLFRRHGVSAYLLKPLNLQDLLEKVKTTIGEP